MWRGYDHYVGRLKKCGFKVLGEGCYSIVLRKGNSPRVIKVSKRGDEAWLQYMHWARTSPLRQKFAPTLYSVKHYASHAGWPGFTVSVIDFLPVIGPGHDRDLDTALLDAAYFDSGDPKRTERAASYLLAHHPGLLHYMTELRDRFCLDIKDANYGRRADGSVVIFDPSTGVLEHMKRSMEWRQELDFEAPKRRYKTSSREARRQAMQRQAHQQAGW